MAKTDRLLYHSTAIGGGHDAGGEPEDSDACVPANAVEAGALMPEDDYFWDDLLDFVGDGKVVPVVGSEMFTTEVGGREVYLSRLVAERVAERVRIPIGELPEGFSLNDVVSRYVHDRRKRKEDLYPRVAQVMKEAALAPSQALRDLASIPRFNLFVTLCFDTLLADAINTERCGGNPRTESISFSPNAPRDLGTPRDRMVSPVVFHLFGKVSSSPEYAICDEDLIEFLHALQEDSRRPKLLFDELRDNHLLIIGTGFTDWLARVFLRTAKGQPLSLNRAQTEILVGSRGAGDQDLVLFLENFSYNTRVVSGTPAEFASELRRRWEARHPEIRESPASAAIQPAAERVAAGAVFVSYASEDIEAVRKLVAALEAAKIDVWLDKGELQPGDDWDRKIRKGIEACALFVPVLSRTTQERTRAFFWQEWNMADECAGRMAPGEAFLLPVVIDDTPPYDANVPERFRKAQWTALRGGEATPAFVEHVTRLYRQFQLRQRAG